MTLGELIRQRATDPADAERTYLRFEDATWTFGETYRAACRYAHLFRARLEFPTPPECWAAQYEACRAYDVAGVPAEAIGASTLVVHGDDDRVVPYANGELLARRIPGAQLETFAGHGHLLALEDPERFNAAVLEFLAA